MRTRRALTFVVAGLASALLLAFVWAHVSFPSDRTPEGAYLRVVIAVNRGRAQDFFAYTETRAQHACYTIRDYRKKTRERVLQSEDAEDVRTEVRRVIDEGAAGGGYAIRTAGQVFDAEIKNLEVMTNEVARYGKY